MEEVYLSKTHSIMEGTTEDIKTGIDNQDFSGNYIENFKGKDAEEFFPGRYVSWEKNNNSFVIHGQGAAIEATVIHSDIIKFRFGNDGYFEDDFSYAIDPEFAPAPVEYKFEELKASFVIKTATLRCYINKENLTTKITNNEGTVIFQDEKGYHWQDHKFHGGTINICTKVLQKGEKFYGLGDKTGNLNLIGTKRELWGTDCYGYGNDTDPVYKNIPFYMGQHSHVGYGLFMDNTFRSFFDFGRERSNVCSFWAQGGEMRYYFIYGPKLVDVAKKYTMLTGTPKLPPKWALGYHQSKWSYYPESVVRKLGEEFRSRKIPCDVIHLDIDYMDGFRCFTWDKKKFPKPEKMIADMKKDGFKTVVIIDPGIKIDKGYKVYDQGRKGNHFCTRQDGALLKASVWPGACHFPDFTRKRTRKWWGTLFEGLVADGVDGVWNDMNEPATFEDGTFPNDVRFDYDGHPCSHRKAHNVYGSLMAQSTCEGQQKYLRNKRAFTITRSAYAGVQRYASVWTGDNSASWEQLKIANIQCQRLSASGVSFVGSDVGGFIGSPNGELYTRWIQMAVFHPFFRTHSSGDHGDKEPWVFDQKYLEIVKEFIELRYRLLPYIYSTFWQHSTTGIPMLRSLHMEAHVDPETFFREEEFMLGDHIIVCPVSEEGKDSRLMYLPKSHWYNYWTDKLEEGQREIKVATPLNQMPIFVRAGAVIPMQPTMQYVGEFKIQELTLNFYKPFVETISQLYEDAGDGLDYLDGDCSTKTFTSTPSGLNKWKIIQHIEGDFKTEYKKYQLRFHGLENKPGSIMIDGVERIQDLKTEEHVLTLKTETKFTEILIN
ncbi:glycoside hydrolase family 31 protein [Reichenbachiella ulvae]|uniref:Glycoside hydrolase family 31 protein n=1 Tax=Reichenbachiella ulvae TaxID=2980104 RepID=A0ABT3CV56_9BACT|nr:glycoside hydrolase family 31 protein [Reichenbachiella ulvae]MCV9387590.1 glycoside hydrolase family 31 protein [Reichenbachiella ulvae]